jgi:hypothetical protein
MSIWPSKFGRAKAAFEHLAAILAEQIIIYSNVSLQFAAQTGAREACRRKFRLM